MNIENEILALYYGSRPGSVKLIDSSRDDGEDIRRCYIADDGERKLVIHEASNTFTNGGRIGSWARLEREYNNLGIYCPCTLPNVYGELSHKINVDGREHYIYAEEMAPFGTAENIGFDKFTDEAGVPSYRDDILRSVGKVASAHFDFCDFASAYCLLEPFCPPDKTDEATECMTRFCEYIKRELPDYSSRADRLRTRFYECRDAVAAIYPSLPVSCFQADLNASNVLIDDGKFKGVIDFNLSGREPVLNYVTRLSMNYVFEKFLYDENDDEIYLFDEKLDSQRIEVIRRNLGVIGETYAFSAAERESFPALFRYMNSFWWEHVRAVKRVKDDENKLELLLSWLDRQLTRNDVFLP